MTSKSRTIVAVISACLFGALCFYIASSISERRSDFVYKKAVESIESTLSKSALGVPGTGVAFTPSGHYRAVPNTRYSDQYDTLILDDRYCDVLCVQYVEKNQSAGMLIVNCKSGEL